MAQSMMSDDGAQRRTYPRDSMTGKSKEISMHEEEDKISAGPPLAGNTGPTGSPRSYPRGAKIDMSANFIRPVSDNYVGGVGTDGEQM